MLRDFAAVVDPTAIKPNLNGFTQTDADLVSNKTAQAKFTKQFATTPYNFNVYVLITQHNQDRNYFRSVANNIVPTQNVSLLENIIDRSIDTNNAITVFYNNNVTSIHNYQPMTGWTLAHRFHHAILFHRKMHNHVGELFTEFERSIFSLLDTLFNHMSKIGCYTHTHHIYKHGIYQTYLLHQHAVRLSNLLLSMRSARNGRINTAVDIPAELIAQYIITGKISLNRASTWDRYQYPQLNRYLTKLYRSAEEKPCLSDDFDHIFEIKDVDYLDSTITDAEQDLNGRCKQLLDACIGKVFGF